MDAFTLAYLAGHTDISVTKRYVDPEDETVRAAMERPVSQYVSPPTGTPHPSRERNRSAFTVGCSQLTRESFVKSGREDSNLRPLGPETVGLFYSRQGRISFAGHPKHASFHASGNDQRLTRKMTRQSIGTQEDRGAGDVRRPSELR
jgi:hypothetical protein